jgi:hypothetical protein
MQVVKPFALAGDLTSQQQFEMHPKIQFSISAFVTFV